MEDSAAGPAARAAAPSPDVIAALTWGGLKIRSLNIAQVCPYDLDRPGGVQTHIKDTAAALAELGHRVTVIAPAVNAAQPASEILFPNVRILRLGRAHRVRLSGTRFEVSLALGRQHRRLAAALRPGRFDVVHYHALWTPALPLQAFVACSAPRVVTFHDTPPGDFGRAMLRAASRALLPRIDEVIAVSDAPRAHLQAGPQQLVRIVPPCTDLRRFTPTLSPPPASTSETVTLLFVGRLEPRKGVMLLLEGYRRLCADGLRVRLVIAGSGGEEPALRRFVARHRLSDVTFLGRFDEAEAPRLYAACDIACAPSPYGESFGIVVAEAMASGRPVVAAANPGYRTLLTGEAAEMLTPPGDAEGLYRTLRRLVLDPPLRARLGAWGLAASKTYDCRNVAPTIVEIYRAAMMSSRAARVTRWLWTPAPDLVAETPDLATSRAVSGD